MTLTNKQIIILVVLGLIMVMGALMPPKDNLTDTQRLEITAFCDENPDALRCQ